MKFLLAILLLSSCYFLSMAQITDNSDTDWTDVQPELVDSIPLLRSLSNFGAQEVIGQALDSRRVSGTNGRVEKIYGVSQLFRDGILQYDIKSLLNIDDTPVSGRYRVLWNPVDNFREVRAWSFAAVGDDLRNPSGSRIAWDSNGNQIRIWDITDAGTWAALLAGNEANPGTFSLSDYLTDVLFYQPIDVATIGDNAVVQSALNSGLDAVSNEANLPGLAVSNLLSAYSFNDPNLGGEFLRFEGDVTSASSNGRATWVWACGANADCSNGTLARYWFNNLLA